jgi:hypothetical protein
MTRPGLTLVFSLCSLSLLAQYKSRLEIGVSGGISYKGSHSLIQKGFAIRQNSSPGLLISLTANFLVQPTFDIKGSLRITEWTQTQVINRYLGAEIGMTSQSSALLQHCIGLNYYPKKFTVGKISPFISASLHYDYFILRQDPMTNKVALDKITTLSWTTPKLTTGVNGLGADLTLGAKYLQNGRMGFFSLLRACVIHQGKTDLLPSTLLLYQFEFGILIRSMKTKSLFRQ